MSHVACHMSRVTCPVSHVFFFFFFFFFFSDKVVKLFVGGFVINEVYPVYFYSHSNTFKIIKKFTFSIFKGILRMGGGINSGYYFQTIDVNIIFFVFFFFSIYRTNVNIFNRDIWRLGDCFLKQGAETLAGA